MWCTGDTPCSQVRLYTRASAPVLTRGILGSSMLGHVLAHFPAQQSSGIVAEYRVFVLRDLLTHSVAYIDTQCNMEQGRKHTTIPSDPEELGNVSQELAVCCFCPALTLPWGRRGSFALCSCTAVREYYSRIQPPDFKMFLLAFFCGELTPATLLCGGQACSRTLPVPSSRGESSLWVLPPLLGPPGATL